MPVIVGGRYGLSSKDFDPAMVKAVFDELKKPAPKRGFTVGINDDVSHTSLTVEQGFDIEPPEVVRALFFGLGADGTVGANKNSTKILRQRSRPLRAGLLRVRLEEVRLFHDLAPALRSATHPRALPAEVGKLRRDPQVRLPLQARYARGRRARRHDAHQQPVPARRGVGRVATGSAAAVRRQETEAVCHRCVECGLRPWSGLTGEHDPADLLFCALGGDGARKGDRGDQAGDRAHAMRGRARRWSRRTFAAIDGALDNLLEVKMPTKAAAGACV